MCTVGKGENREWNSSLDTLILHGLYTVGENNRWPQLVAGVAHSSTIKCRTPAGHLPNMVVGPRARTDFYFNTPPWPGKTPIAVVNLLCNGLCSGLVKMSARFEVVGTYVTLIVPSLTWSRRKCISMSICFVRAWNSGWCEIEIAA